MEMPDSVYILHYDSPLGKITLAGDREAVTGLWFDGQKYDRSTLPEGSSPGITPPLAAASAWLDRYFAGEGPVMDLPLRPEGSSFRQQVWRLLLEISCGETVTYKMLAARLEERTGRKSLSAQAVGGAVGHNPISILIPCHRVVGADGSLTGYSGGLEKKRYLLELERNRESLRRQARILKGSSRTV